MERMPLRRWFLPLLLVLSCAAGYGQSRSVRPAGDESIPAPIAPKTVTVPVTPAHDPLPWVAAPDGKGEFLLTQADAVTAYPLGKRTLYATALGLYCVNEDGRASFVPALYGKTVLVAGEYDGKLWVQDTHDDIIALDPTTLTVVREYPEVHGQCLAVAADGFWCLDTYELTRFFIRTRGMNSAPAAYALIQYDREGKEKRRWKADGSALPESEIAWAKVDDDAVWMVAHACLGVICGCGARDYANAHFYRIDRRSGEIQVVKSPEQVTLPIHNLPDRFIWLLNDGQRTAVMLQLDKRTLTITRLGRVPSRYIGGDVVVSGSYLWCFSDTMRESNPQSPAVFSLKDGSRVHLAAAGTPPPRTTGESAAQIRQPLNQTRFLGADAQRVWLYPTGGKLLYEVRDDGTVFQRDLGAAKILTKGTPFKFASQPGVLIITANYPSEELARVTADDANIVLASPPGPNSYSIVSDRRLWFSSSRALFTSTADMWISKVDLPVGRNEMRVSVAVGDELYLLTPKAFTCIDGQTGKSRTIDSWCTQFTEEQRTNWQSRHAFSTKEGILVFLLTAPSGKEQPDAVLLNYDPAHDRWQQHMVPRWDGGQIVSTPHGVFTKQFMQPDLYRITSTGIDKVGALPFETPWYSLDGGTTRYLYIDSPIGLYRTPWEKVLQP